MYGVFVCVGVGGCMRIESVCRCARVCGGGPAWVCVKVFRGIWVYLSMVLETRFLTSADFNTCPIRILRLLQIF